MRTWSGGIARSRSGINPLGLRITAAVSLAAQLSVAQTSPSGSLLSMMPPLALMALVKLVCATRQWAPPPHGLPHPADSLTGEH